MVALFRVFVAFAIIVTESFVNANNPEVNAPVGIIRGQSRLIKGVSVDEFLGIPYATAPRFQFAVRRNDIGELNATKFSFRCPQPNFGGDFPNPVEMSEDCLSLNVYRKTGTKRGDNIAVVVFIHGGAFSTGSASDLYYSAAPLAALGDLIVVNFNYRVGVLGFADINNLVPGNLGLYDQRLLLEWVQDNIAAFGGNPERVTLFGVSAGSMSVSAHIATPLNRVGRRLFHAAILDAGVMDDGIASDPDVNHGRMKAIAAKLNCSIEAPEMLECLRRADVDKLVQLSVDIEGYSPLYTLLPTTDGVFLPKNIAADIRDNAKDYVDIKMLIGYARDEGSLFAGYEYYVEPANFPNLTTENDFVNWCKKLSFGYKYPLDFDDDAVKRNVSTVYYNKTASRFRDAWAFVGDGTFMCPMNAFVTSYAKTHPNVFVYRFDRKLRRVYPYLDCEVFGAFHSIPYLHMTGLLYELDSVIIDEEDNAYFLDGIKLVASFAKTDDTPIFRGVHWPNFSKGEGVLVFDDNTHVSPTLFAKDRCESVFRAFSGGK